MSVPSVATVWAMICWWTVVLGFFVGYVSNRLARITRAVDTIATTYCASEHFKRCPKCNGPDADDEDGGHVWAAR